MTTISDLVTRCPYSQHIPSYADCTLDDVHAALLEQHLTECESCNLRLAEAIDSGVAPAWLSSLVDGPADTIQTNNTEQHNGIGSSDAPTVSAVPTDHRYQRIRLQGEGGMGQVWLGWDTVMQRRVALKQLRSEQRSTDRDRRLWQEATSLARLAHPNIVTVHEVLLLDAQPTLVMEFIDGPTLASISRDFVVSERQAAKLVEQLASAIAHAHDQGVIHRDLKPSNVLLSGPVAGPMNGQVAGSVFESVDAHSQTPSVALAIEHAIPKLTDFGLAKLQVGDDLTRTGELLGTPAYMAPEQTIGLASISGPSTDIYGLGAILYDLLTGTPPHVAENPIATMIQVREREPTAPRVLRPELSRDIETICLKCLRKVPKDRYASASALREDLRAYLEGKPIRARPLGWTYTVMRWSRRHKSVVVSVALAASLLATLVLGSLWTASKERQLRLDAEVAKSRALQSEKKVIAEAQRANDALEVNREHFEVALDRMNRLADLAYNPHNKQVSTLDFGREIQQATADIYATYLSTLPAPEQWTLEEAQAVTYYVKYMVALRRRELAAPWLERVTSVVSRLERESSGDPTKLHEFLAEHYHNAVVHTSAVGDFAAAAQYGEQAGRFVDVDARQAAFVLTNSAITYNKIGSHQDAIRVVNRAVEVYRSAMESHEKPDDIANFLEQLRMHRQVALEAGDMKEAEKHVEEFATLSSRVDSSSPYYLRVQATTKAYGNLK